MLHDGCVHMEHGKYAKLGTCKTMVSKLASKGKLTTNGKKGRALRIYVPDIRAMILRLRDEDLDLADWEVS